MTLHYGRGCRSRRLLWWPTWKSVWLRLWGTQWVGVHFAVDTSAEL